MKSTASETKRISMKMLEMIVMTPPESVLVKKSSFTCAREREEGQKESDGRALAARRWLTFG